jgi:uncharacterized protein (TIGR02996 family)
MNEREAFLRAIFESPDDDAPRLVYADWLEENKDPLQAAFVRVQVELAKLARDDPRERGLRARERELWRTVKRWRFLPRGWTSATLDEYRRGFPVWCRGSVGDFLAALPDLWQIGPPEKAVVSVDSPGDAAQLRALAACPAVGPLRHLTLCGACLDDIAARDLLSSPRLRGLRSLHLSGDGMSNESARFLATSPFVESLRRLQITLPSLTPHGRKLLREAFGDRAAPPSRLRLPSGRWV